MCSKCKCDLAKLTTELGMQDERACMQRAESGLDFMSHALGETKGRKDKEDKPDPDATPVPHVRNPKFLFAAAAHQSIHR